MTLESTKTSIEMDTAGLVESTCIIGMIVIIVVKRKKNVNAVNMGSQVPNEELIAKAIELNADAILVSQTVTQKDVHIKNLTNMVELCEAEGIRDRMLLLCGGPRISHELAQELGFDAGFGPETYAEHVCSYVMQEIVARGWAKR